MRSGLFWSCPTLCIPVTDYGLPGFSVREGGVAARTPATQAAAPPPHLTLTGANPSPPGQPQEQTPVDDPHAEVEIKPQLNPRTVWLRNKTQNLPTSYTSCRLNPHDQLGRLCVKGIYKRPLRVPTKENALVLTAVDIGGENTHQE